MPYHIETLQKEDHLLISVSGTIEPTDLGGYARAVDVLANKMGCHRVLIDERSVSRKVDQYDCINHTNQWLLHNPGLKVAAVFTPDDAHKFRWIETILQNRSFVYKIFDDISEAKRWLLS